MDISVEIRHEIPDYKSGYFLVHYLISQHLTQFRLFLKSFYIYVKWS